MAGDIGVEEQVILAPTETHAVAAAAFGETARQEGARVVHRYGPRVMIGEVPEHRTEHVATALAAAVAAAPHQLPAHMLEGLDAMGALGLAAFSLRQSAEYIAAKEQRPHQDTQWDDGGHLLPPDPPEQHQHLTMAPAGFAMDAQAAVGSTSKQMTGSIAVGIIIVSGPTADLQFSQAETQKVVAEVQNGLGWHAAQNHAANISWTYDIHSVTVNVPPGGGTDKEALWRDPAMARLGYSANWQGVIDYVNHIRTQYGTQWTYVGFFTKYPLDWFAYASIGGPRLVMQYANDGWGPDNIDRVFAHETGHIFQAPDEYSASNCNCGGSWGIYDQPNGNCQLCVPGGGVDCLMRSNSWAYCHWTPWHYGFPKVSITKPLGAITVDGGRPYVFVQGGDNKMWVNWWTGSAWSWAYQGTPSGVNITRGVGAVTVDGGRPYVFIEGSDGNLWVNWWSGSAWSWANQSHPPGVTLADPMGVVAVDGSRPYAFVKGSDGNLWVNWWTGSAWSWANQGRPSGVNITSSVGAVLVDGGRPYVFIKGSDGNLWVNWWTGSAWSWANQSRPSGVNITDSMGVVSVDGSRPYAFVKGSDGNLWVNWWTGSAWSWANQTRPSGVNISSAAGAVIVDGGRPYVFIKGSDGNLWVNWWSGTAWAWANQARPSGVNLSDSMGSITVDGGRPYAFIKGSDGNLWVNWWSGSAWAWANQYTPSP